MSCNSAKNNFKSWETPTSLTFPSPCTSGLHSGMRLISSRGWYLGQVKHNTGSMVKCPTIPKQTKKMFSGSWRICVPGDGVTARDAFHQSRTLLFFFVGGWRGLLLHGEHHSPIWHMTYTQLLVKHRPQHKLTCQIPKKTRGAVSSLRIAFQHLICNATKRTAGDMGAGAVPDSAEPTSPNRKTGSIWKSDAQADKTVEMLL